MNISFDTLEGCLESRKIKGVHCRKEDVTFIRNVPRSKEEAYANSGDLYARRVKKTEAITAVLQSDRLFSSKSLPISAI